MRAAEPTRRDPIDGAAGSPGVPPRLRPCRSRKLQILVCTNDRGPEAPRRAAAPRGGLEVYQRAQGPGAELGLRDEVLVTRTGCLQALQPRRHRRGLAGQPLVRRRRARRRRTSCSTPRSPAARSSAGDAARPLGVTPPRVAASPSRARAGRDLARVRRARDGGAPAAGRPGSSSLDDGERLHVDFDCDDDDAWATLTRARRPALAARRSSSSSSLPARRCRTRYFEFEINPLGALFDARVDSRTATAAA